MLPAHFHLKEKQPKNPLPNMLVWKCRKKSEKPVAISYHAGDCAFMYCGLSRFLLAYWNLLYVVNRNISFILDVFVCDVKSLEKKYKQAPCLK